MEVRNGEDQTNPYGTPGHENPETQSLPFPHQRGLLGRATPSRQNASALQKWPLSGHLAFFRGSKRKPRKHHFDQCLRGYEGWWRLALHCRTSFDPEYAKRLQK